MLVHRLIPNQNHIVISNVFDDKGRPVEVVVLVTKVAPVSGASCVAVCAEQSVRIRRVDEDFVSGERKRQA